MRSDPLYGPNINTFMPGTGGKCSRCTEVVLSAGFITMFVLGILGTQNMLSVSPGGAYAMIAVGAWGMLASVLICYRAAKNANCCKGSKIN